MQSPVTVALVMLVGLGLTSASTFTTAFARRWGERAGRCLTMVLRVGLGMPLWVLGLVLAARAAGPRTLPSSPALNILAGVLLGAGVGVVLWALPAVGRRALAPSSGDTLVLSGPYAFVRHPVYSGCLLEFAGLALAFPTLTFVLACAVSGLWLLLQARLEEQDLLQRLPAYAGYMRRVPRFIPRLRSAKRT